MNTTQRNFIGLMALALLIALAPVTQAQAKVVVRATVKTPHLSVKVSNTPVARRYVHPRVIQRPVVVRLDKQDRQMARRLASISGATRGEILELKRDGYSWEQIGRFLNLNPRAVRAARHAISWNRYLDFGRHTVVRCGNH